MYRVLDLFSGIGGISLGLERTGAFETIAFCEVDKAAQKVLKKHWPSVPIFEDVKTLSTKDIDGAIDVIVGGFPCQDISLAGKGAGLEGERSGLWWEFHRLIKEAQPKWVIAENVSALRSRGLDQVLRSLDEIGYDAEWHCIPASAVGAPHQRDRIWIVAHPRHGSRGNLGSPETGDHSQSQRSADSDTAGGSGKQPETMANPSGSGRPKLHWKPGSGHQGIYSTEGKCTPVRSSPFVANSIHSGSQGWIHRWADQEREGELGYLGRCRTTHGQPIEDWWAVEPNVGRVANGVPGRAHRLKQLGNAVVPQIPELLGRAIISQGTL